MLEIKNFSKKYGDKEAVSHLSFVVNDGDIMGFVGKNGAGKTTTLKACMGIITITEGDILLDGISVVKEPIVCKRKMAYVPDTPRLEEYMTGMQYLNFVCDIYQISAKERKQNIERLIHAFQMEPHISGLISSYSHGKENIIESSEMYIALYIWPKYFSDYKIGLDFYDEANSIWEQVELTSDMELMNTDDLDDAFVEYILQLISDYQNEINKLIGIAEENLDIEIAQS